MADARVVQNVLDGAARDWFDRLPYESIHNWTDMWEWFVERFALRRRNPQVGVQAHDRELKKKKLRMGI
ncbi:hypothetical protein Tco_1110029 [Tanacetum coccineum]|uniref:Retrotransposon gag domain-containing protein n=1 Tax=Tanacetum coccineum TaxID=301880 RepID=A0ABQ5IIT9_9ASTR